MAVRDQMTDSSGNVTTSRLDWKFHGVGVCRSFWAHAYFTGPNTIDHHRHGIKEGLTQPAETLARMPNAKSSAATNKADSYFLNMYNSLAEPMPTEDCAEDIQIGDMHEMIESSSHPLFSLTNTLMGSGQRYAPKKVP